MTEQPSDLLTVAEAAVLLRVSAPTVRRKIAGELPAHRLGDTGAEVLRIRRSDLDDFLAAHRVGGTG